VKRKSTTENFILTHL